MLLRLGPEGLKAATRAPHGPRAEDLSKKRFVESARNLCRQRHALATTKASIRNRTEMTQDLFGYPALRFTYAPLPEAHKRIDLLRFSPPTVSETLIGSDLLTI